MILNNTDQKNKQAKLKRNIYADYKGIKYSLSWGVISIE